MALPKINEFPNYQLTIPSTKQKISYRPFLVKEQKVLLIAMESQNQSQMLNAIVNTIDACVTSDIEVSQLATFDVEYIFTQIRSKSAGESANIAVKCEECEEDTEVTVEIDDIEIDTNKDKDIKLNDEYTLTMRYPRWSSMVDIDANQETLTDALYTLALCCLDIISSEDEQIKFDDETEEEKNSFLENLTSDQFKDVMEFVNNLPKLTKNIDFNCGKCNHANSITLTGMNDFF
tara:strand:- start:2065 stop:2766 length:702 start_codon:yes stop_codon:yes gene_type:complete